MAGSSAGQADERSNAEADDLLAPPASRSLADDITERLRAALLAGRFAPGERLGEEALARKMAVSRGPIREAFARLEREGLIVTRRNRGAFVARLALDDLTELYTLRRALEPLALQRAISFADSGDFAAMEQIIAEMARYQQQGITAQTAAELDLQFHDLIYQAARHRRLYDAWSTIRPQIHILLLNRNAASADFRDVMAAGHQQLLDALRDRNEPLAQALMQEHLAGSYERLALSYQGPECSVPGRSNLPDERESV